jgi:hypothetical protein
VSSVIGRVGAVCHSVLSGLGILRRGAPLRRAIRVGVDHHQRLGEIADPRRAMGTPLGAIQIPGKYPGLSAVSLSSRSNR